MGQRLKLDEEVLAWVDCWQPRVQGFVTEQMAAADGAHDLAHVQRVVVNAQRLMALESADPQVVLPAAWLHDCVLVPKNSPLRGQASQLAAQRATDFLTEQNYPADVISAVAHAIEAHSFSAGIVPQSIEAKVVQDADRLDALGAIGIARCFLTAGATQAALHSPVDPWGHQRSRDDRRYAVDHFFEKLLKLPGQMQTASGTALAQERAQVLLDFLQQMSVEAAWD